MDFVAGIETAKVTVVAIELVGMFARANLVFNDDGEAVHVVNDENVNMMPLARKQ